jgi:serine/threonine-protein kinase
MGTIHKVLDRALLRSVASKRLIPNQEDGSARDRFVAEAQITSQLEHPHIVPVHDLGTDEAGQPHFTMKLVRGETLARLMRTAAYDVTSEQGVRPFLYVLLKVCDAVSYAHSRRVVHRDLKPDNIMVGDHGQVYVMDWGVALPLAGEAEAAGDEDVVRLTDQVTLASARCEGMVIGTPGYMAPEQAWGRTAEIDERTDVFLLGGILYEALTRHPPHQAVFTDEGLELARNVPVPPPETVAAGHRSLPPALCRVAMRALAPDKADRYRSVGEMKQDLETYLRGGTWFGVQEFSAGALIIRQGDDADAAYIISRGQCEAVLDRDGSTVSLRRMGPGEVFGEAGIFTSKPRTASVLAVTDVEAVVVTRDQLEDELRLGSWTGAFVRTLAHRFRELDAQLSQAQERFCSDEIVLRVVEHVAVTGVPAAQGGREASWRACLDQLVSSGLYAAGQVERALAGAPHLRVDAARDVVTLTCRGCAPQPPGKPSGRP